MKTDQIIDAIGEIDEELIVSALGSRQGAEAAVQKQAVRDEAPAGAQKKKKKWFIIPAALAAVFALFLIIMPGGMGSTTNQKYVVPISDTQIYFTSHPTRFRQEALCLYDTETGKTTRILNNTIALKTASGIIGFNRADGSIYKLSGEQAEKIGELKSEIKLTSDYAFAGDELYFLYSWKAVCKENIKTGQVTELVRRENKFGYVDDLGISGGKVFYTDTGVSDGEVRLNVYTVDDTGQETKVCEIKAEDGSDFTGAYKVTYFDDYLTVSIFDGLFIIDAETLSCRKIRNKGTGSISLHDGKLYFTDEYLSNEYLLCIDPVSGEETAVMPVKSAYSIDSVSGEATTLTSAKNVYNSWGFYVTGKGCFYVDIRTGLYYWPFGADQPVHIDK